MGDPSIVHGEYSDDDGIEPRLRPLSLKDFQGQDAVKENLAVFIRAARERDDSLDHVFLSGPPGLGKTTLAGIMAHEMGAEFKVTSAPALDKPKDLAGILTTLSEGSVFFIDEVHRLKPAMEEMLYIAMEDFELDWIVGQGPAARTIRIPIPPFTLVGATTKPGLVAGPLHSRFGITVRLDFYTLEDIVKIVRRSTAILGIDATDAALELIARSARGTPRVANRLLRRVRDFAQVLGDGTVEKDIVAESMKRLEIDSYGLETHDRRILATIIEHYDGGPVGADTLAISIGEGIDTLEDFYEPYLIQRGFLKRTPRGRMVTPLALDHLGYSPDGRKREDQGFLF
ncbi:MAG: Holliday junction branch migration DNA helicase RuvB [Spirochaetota bacterium]